MKKIIFLLFAFISFALSAQVGVYVPTQAIKVWNVNGNGNWGTSSNWVPQDYPGGFGDVATLDETAGTTNKQITLNITPVMLSVLNHNSVTGSINIASTPNQIIFQTLDGSQAQYNTSGAGSKSISCAINLQSPLLCNASGPSTIIGAISGSQTIEKTGSGVLTVTGTNTFIGDIKVTAGQFAIQAETGLGNSANNVLFNGGNLGLNNGAFTVNRGFNLTIGGAQFSPGGANIVTLAGVISGGFGVSNVGTGILKLTGTNTFTGTVAVNGSGTSTAISCGADNNLGNSANGVNVGASQALDAYSSFSTSRAITLGFNSKLTAGTGATLTINGTISSGANNITVGGSGTVNINSSWAGTGQITNSSNVNGGLNGLLQITAPFTGASGQTLSIQAASTTECNTTIKAVTMASNGALWFAAGFNGAVAACTTGTMTTSSNTNNSLRFYSSGSSISTMQINGNLILNTMLDFPSTSLNTGTYTILNYTGTITNTSCVLGVNNTGKTISINVDTTNKRIQITVT